MTKFIRQRQTSNKTNKKTADKRKTDQMKPLKTLQTPMQHANVTHTHTHTHTHTNKAVYMRQ